MNDRTWLVFRYPNGDAIGLSLATDNELPELVNRLTFILRKVATRTDHHAGTWHYQKATTA